MFPLNNYLKLMFQVNKGKEEYQNQNNSMGYNYPSNVNMVHTYPPAFDFGSVQNQIPQNVIFQ